VSEPRAGTAQRLALGAIAAAAVAIVAGYAAAFLPGGAPPWAPWLLAAGIPVMLVGTMALGAARHGRVSARLAIPFLLVGAMLLAGFVLALVLPADEAAHPALWLGLPRRAAIVLYGIGLLPIVVLPVAYALTFEAQTLSPEDLERVRATARARAKGGSASAQEAA
jgi:hypothetical protein